MQVEVSVARKKVEEFASKHIGISAVHPQQDPKQWPGPEGQNCSRPSTNVLRKSYDKTEENDYEMLLKCSINYHNITVY